ncbi:ABC transporter substrate-binding protein [Actinomycetaceae bacterium TAE3-ERU4]|nr:ABC transporter substrate-binding protein [Actinomycetaceae bacterium TAE3-ERU4]
MARRALVALVATSALALTACLPHRTPVQKVSPPTSGTIEKTSPKRTLKIALSYNPGTGFDPAKVSGILPISVNWHIFEGLMEINPDTGEIYPALAAQSPNKINDTTYRITLRENARFSDSTPVTADDVVFSYERILSPFFPDTNLYRSFLGFIKTVKKVDNKTVEITLNYPYSYFVERLSLVKIIPKEKVQKDSRKFNRFPIGSGPFSLKANGENGVLAFTPNRYYNGSKTAPVEDMEWRLIQDPQERTHVMKENEVDLITSLPSDTYNEHLLSNGDIRSEAIDSFALTFFMFNTQHKPFNDKRVRQAFFYALDYDQLTNTDLGGLATPATSYLQESNPAYQKASTIYSHNPEKAKELLKAAGVKNLELTVNTTNQDSIKRILPRIKENLQSIGIKIKFNSRPTTATYKDIDAGNYDVLIAPGDPSVFGKDPDILLRWYYGKNIWSQKRYAWDKSPEFKQIQKLLDEASTSMSNSDARLKYLKIYNLIADNAVLYPLFHKRLTTAYDTSKLEKYTPLNTTGVYFLNTVLKNPEE